MPNASSYNKGNLWMCDVFSSWLQSIAFLPVFRSRCGLNDFRILEGDLFDGIIPKIASIEWFFWELSLVSSFFMSL